MLSLVQASRVSVEAARQQVPARMVEAVRARVLDPAADLAHSAGREGAAAGASAQRWATLSWAKTRHWAAVSSEALGQRLSSKVRPRTHL